MKEGYKQLRPSLRRGHAVDVGGWPLSRYCIESFYCMHIKGPTWYHASILPILTSLSLLSIDMAASQAACVYTTQVSARVSAHDLHPHDQYRPPSPATSLSPTLVNETHYTERPSLKLRFPSGASNILNSVVVNAAGQSLYSISSDSKRTTLVSCSDNVEIANVQWDCHSPRMVFRRKKIKCKAWLPLTGPENEYMTAPLYPVMSF